MLNQQRSYLSEDVKLFQVTVYKNSLNNIYNLINNAKKVNYFIS